MSKPRRQISDERKTLYYAGMGVSAIGVLLFLSTFVSHIANFGDFTDFEGRARSMGIRAIGGMVLIIAGGAMMNVGKRGFAGSGVVLDPERAREDVEPWSRMSGGITNDALSEIDVVNKLSSRLDAPAPEVKVRCQKCQTLNEETAKFCNQCGSTI